MKSIGSTIVQKGVVKGVLVPRESGVKTIQKILAARAKQQAIPQRGLGPRRAAVQLVAPHGVHVINGENGGQRVMVPLPHRVGQLQAMPHARQYETRGAIALREVNAAQ